MADVLPNQTIYVHNLYEKVKKEGTVHSTTENLSSLLYVSRFGTS